MSSCPGPGNGTVLGIKLVPLSTATENCRSSTPWYEVRVARLESIKKAVRLCTEGRVFSCAPHRPRYHTLPIIEHFIPYCASIRHLVRPVLAFDAGPGTQLAVRRSSWLRASCTGEVGILLGLAEKRDIFLVKSIMQ